MRVLLAILILLLSTPFTFAQNVEFAQWFENKAMRVDLYHSGNIDVSKYSLDEVIIEGQWPGTRTKLVSNLNIGDSLFRVFDAETGQEIYSRGFSTYFAEWQTVDEAKIRDRTISETVRFPKPLKDFELAIYERNDDMEFIEVYRVKIDPNFRNNRREIRYKNAEVFDLHVPSTEPRKTFDILILPEGYTAEEKEKLRKDSERVASYYMETEPYKELKDHIAIRGIEVFSRDSGIDEPRQGIFKDTMFGCTYNSFDSARYVLTVENKTIRDVAANANYDVIIIMVNSDRYGGGGILNLYATFAVDDEEAPYLVLHESGHSFSGLADEYYTSQVSYEGFYKEGVEPWEPNITALLDPENIKWKKYIKEGTPIPTPATEEYKDVVGAFEGAGYVAKGFYRPMLTSMMKDKILDYGPVSIDHVRKVILFNTEE